jgi:transposase
MAWTKTTRKQYRRDGLRYASDTTDKEWKLMRPLLPKRSRTGRPPECCSSRASGWSSLDHALGSPVLRTLSLCTCCRQYPGTASVGRGFPDPTCYFMDFGDY